MDSTESPSRCPRPTEHGESDPIWLLYSATLLVCDALAFPRWAATCMNTYKSVAHRPNLVVFAEARATKIGIEQAIDCQGWKGSRSLGWHSSDPLVLELSGTGNSNVLQKHKVSLKVGLLGAGENCQARVLVSTTYEVKKNASEVRYGKARDRPLTASHSMLSHIDLYFLASSAKVVHMHTSLWEYVRKEIHMVLPNEQYRIEELSLRKKMSDVEMLPHPGKYTIWDFPKSRADRIDCHAQHQNTSDSVSPPAIGANYLSKQVDRSMLVELVMFADKLAKAEPLGTILVARQGPSPDIESDKVITKRAKGNNRTLHHPIRTAVMASDLRVMNPSVIPVHLAVQLHHAVYGIAERATDAIKSGLGF
ncbi:GMC oxidoreductase [Rhizoctonia solani]|uniref:GMC oxidoreductase n=1 Tax=Rhizoctonia solani TaxID=456999 RepID=A0A8H8NP79_9AGAM|nr:GMC oxidoreductase [Rhizoctonia solani]QRW17359.1 GMC oxidoreductase [Rhizoctonia solani]